MRWNPKTKNYEDDPGAIGAGPGAADTWKRRDGPAMEPELPWDAKPRMGGPGPLGPFAETPGPVSEAPWGFQGPGTVRPPRADASPMAGNPFQVQGDPGAVPMGRSTAAPMFDLPPGVPDLPPDVLDEIEKIGQQPWNQGKPRDQWNPYPPGSPHNPAPAAPTGPDPNAPAPVSPGGPDNGTFGDSWMKSGGRNVNDLRSHVEIWNREHPEDKVELFGSKNDKIRYRGRVYDAVLSAGVNGGLDKTWNDITDGDGSGNGIDPSYLEPWTTPFEFDPFAYDPFKPPSADDVFADPSYQFRLKQGLGALQYSKAAQGLTNTGNTLRALLEYGQDFGAQEYGNVFARHQNTWNANRTNAADQWAKNYDAAWKRYLDQKDSWYRNQDGPFDKLYRLGSLGAGAAS